MSFLDSLRSGLSRTFWVANVLELFERFAYYGSKAILVPTIAGAVVAMMIFALGEAIQSPRFYEYVANLAPPEQVGTYMGFAFLPIAIGTFIAGWSSGYLVERFVEGGNPQAPQMWFVVGAYGVVSTILLVLYDRFVTPKRAAA